MCMSITERVLRCIIRNNNNCSLSKITSSLPDVDIWKRERAIEELICLKIIKKEQVKSRRFAGLGRSYEKTIYKIVT